MQLQGRNLAFSMQGDDIKLLHNELQQLGYPISAEEQQKALFGATTLGAVQLLQQRHGLEPTGVVDEKTAALLQQKPGATFAHLASVTQPPTQEIPVLDKGQQSSSGQGTPEAGTQTPDNVVGRQGTTPALGLSLGATGDAVAELQLSLTTIGLPIDAAERDAKQFGTSTATTVRKLQALSALPQTGTVDEQTRTVITTALDRLGVRISGKGTPIVITREYSVEGHVTNLDGEPMPKATVVALSLNLRSAKELGRTVTNATGFYRIAYTPEAFTPSQSAADLQVELLNTDGKVALASPITFNAPRQTIINLALGGTQRAQPSEFSTLTSTLTPLLGNLAPTGLREDTQYHDLTFLAGATGVAKPQIALWSIAAHVASNTQLPAELFYALFRSNIPANAGTIALASSTQGTDLATNAQLLQEAILSTSPQALEKALNGALANNLLPASYAGRAKQDLAQLGALANTAALNSVHGMGKTSIASVMNVLAVAPDVQNKFIQLYANVSSAGLRTFWSDLAKNPAFTAAQVADLHFGVTVGRLTRGYLPLITELASMRSAQKITHARDLARLSVADWTTLLQIPVNGKPIGIPANITASTPELALQAYASMLERDFTLAYPTVDFSARLKNDTKSPFQAGQAVATYLDANPAFDLTITNIDAFAKTTPMATDVRSTLLIAQRLAKLDPSYAAMSTMLADGIHSAGQIYRMGRDQFVAKYAKNQAISPTQAARIYARSEQTYGMALSLVTRFNQAFTSNNPAAIGSINYAALLKQVSTSSEQAATIDHESTAEPGQFPNLQTLFGSDSYCACDDCQSVLGDAAYLVDMLEFLNHRSANNGQSARDALLARRPDIAQIELSCPNTNTALPYIDLVNELLEDAVAPPSDPSAAARSRQTTLTTPELNANPEYVNQEAYTGPKKLGQAVFPWILPFDFPLAEARTYLGQLGLDRAQLVRTFQKPAGYPPTDATQARFLAVETLGFSAVEADIVTPGTHATGNQSWDYWGLAQNHNTIVDPYDPTKKVSGSWIDVLTQTRVLLSRANLTYQELARLLNTFFINYDGTVSIVCDSPDSCDVATMTMAGLTQDVLDRIHCFVRLWRRLGWNVYDLDDAIWILQNATPNGLGRLNDQLLRQLAVVATISKRYNLPVRRVVTFFFFPPPTPAEPVFATIPTRDIPTLPGDDVQNSLYHDLFENLTILNPPDPIFALNADGTEIAGISSNPLLTDPKHSATLTAAFQISNSDLNLAIAAFTDGHLTLANLSAIYRNVQLANVLGITLSELITLLAIVEAPIDAAPNYESVSPFDGTRPESLLTFIDTFHTIAGSGLSIEQLDYVLRAVYTDASGIAPDPVMVGTLLLTLRNGLIKIAAQTASSPDPTGTTTRKELAKLLPSADVDTTMAILAGTSTLSATEQNTFIGTTLGAFMDAADAQAKLVGAAALQAGEFRYEYVLQNILTYEQQTLGTRLVVQSLAQALSITTATAALLVKNWFTSASKPGNFAIDDFLALPSVTLIDTADPISPNDPHFKTYFSMYGQLAKAALLVTSLGLSTDDIKWWHDKGVGLGWLDPTTLPTSPPTATAEGRFYSWIRLLTARKVRDSIPASAPSFSAAFDLAGGSTLKKDYLPKLSTLMQWPLDALNTFCGDPANPKDPGLLAPVYPDDFVCERALSRLIPCFKMLKATGIPADVSAWIDADVTSDAADAIKQSVKANYPTDQWLTLAKQLRDGQRECQRDALVAYLLTQAPPAGAPRWLDPNDVFAWFLIDVEMGSCMATSRIVQATAAVQLFVQRCFLNLEPEVTVDATVDPDWLQWQWMYEYRLWQANREVFLFPENWLDPSLRSNKSPFFTDLEQELKQNNLTNDTAETALENYLEKLEAVARLDVCGTFHEMENGRDVLHVLARKQGDPPIYYMRQWVDSSSWTAWEKVDLDITSDHILPVVWNGKPYLFWAIVNIKPDQTQSNLDQLTMQSSPNHPPHPNVHLEVQLAWSQHKRGKWQAKQTAPQVLVLRAPSDITPKSSDITLKSSFNGPVLEIDVFFLSYELYSLGPHSTWRSHVAAFLLGGAGNGVEAFMADTSGLNDVGPKTAGIGPLDSSLIKPPLWSPTDSSFDGEWIAPDSSSQGFLSTSRLRVGPTYTTYDLYGALQSEIALNQADYYRLIVPHQTPTFDSSLPFFYRDSAREYFCVPTDYFQNENYLTINAPAYVYHPFFRAEYRFWPFYHAFVPLFVSQLNKGGVAALYDGKLQLNPASVAGLPDFDFASYYQPTNLVLPLPDGSYPQEGVDFAPEAGYALYNWELFFHTPFLIAELLTNNQRFAEAQQWYEYIFNPTSATNDSIPQRYWVTAPFYNMSKPDYAKQQITALMQDINAHDRVLEHQVAAWRYDPFDPDMIAQSRYVAYQRAIFMKYIDNLIRWGDQLFMQDTRETINLATQLYVLAYDLLGPRPEIVNPRVQPEVKTYADLEGSLDTFSNELVAAENAIPPVRVNVPTNATAPKLPTLNTLYFRIPPNQNLLTYWDTIDDRLYKIRHCMNIQGVVQLLPLFSSAISPGLLIAAAAAGLDLGSVLSDSNAAVPPYRFRTMIRQALEMCEQVRGLGGELLQALEKSDAENLARIRSGSESQLQAAIADVRSRQIDEAAQQIDALTKSKQASIDRVNFYQNRPLMNDWEAWALGLQAASLIPDTIAMVLERYATAANAEPSTQAGTSGVGGSPHVSLIIGGVNIANSASSGATVLRITAALMRFGAQMSTTLGQYNQRQDQWKLEAALANDEIARIDSEILAAQIRQDIASKELNAQNIAVTEAANVDAFLHSKFTNQELYDWMAGEISTTYFQAYQLAYALAKQAEQCFRRELALTDDQYYIQFGYWDSLRKGLTAAEKLQYDLRHLESAYYTQNARELELKKRFSLAQLDPYALMELRNNGTCLISLPELLFDLDNPGHYVRRLKTVGVTIPCVVGPYSGVSLTLSLLDNYIRVSPETSGGYPGAVPPNSSAPKNRFIYDLGGTSEIVTSSGQNDNGLFELRFEDERYLPFEGAGAISNWRLTLNNVYPQFDYSTITDVVLDILYTARDGGSAFTSTVSNAVKAQLNSIALAESRKGLYRMFSARYDYGTAWARFLNPGTGNDQVLNMPTQPERFPFYTYGLDLKVTTIDVLSKTSDAGDYTLVITPPGGTATTVTFSADPALGGVHHWENSNVSPKIDLGKVPSNGATPPTWSFMLKKASATVTDFRSLTADDLDDLVLIVGYEVS